MNDHRDPNELLKDVFAQSASDQFRAELLGRTLQAAARHKRQRRLRLQVLGSFLILATLAVTLKFVSRTSPLPSAPNRADPLYVHSQPLPSSMMVKTIPGLPIVVRSSNSISVFQTASSRTYERIGDDKLFSLLGGRPAVVVRMGPGETRFRFLDGDDQSGWPVQ